MTEADTGLAVLLATSVAVSMLVHWHERRFLRAVVMSAIVATVLFQALAYLQAGSMDPLIIVAAIVGAGLSALVATGVGILFRWYRRGQVEHP